jgi:isocitrate/isopropylmalate dehydrogenase
MNEAEDTIPHIAVVYGDGAPPEIMDAVLFVLKEARARIVVETVDLGGLHYEHGVTTGVLPSVWGKLQRTSAMLKAPILTPEPTKEQKFESVTDMLFSTLKLFTCEKLSVNHLPLSCIAHIGAHYAVFEPARGATENSDDFSSLLHAAVAMLIYLDQAECAERIYKAWHETVGSPETTVNISSSNAQTLAETVAECLQANESLPETGIS